MVFGTENTLAVGEQGKDSGDECWLLDGKNEVVVAKDLQVQTEKAQRAASSDSTILSHDPGRKLDQRAGGAGGHHFTTSKIDEDPQA